MFKRILREAAVFFARHIYIRYQILVSKYKLKGYTDDIIEIIDGKANHNSKIFCAFVYYEPNGKISLSAQNIFSELTKNNVNVVSICNMLPSEVQIKFLQDHSHKIILRGNTGFDFGAYKDAITWLSKSKYDIERFVLLNDSVYYFSKGLGDFVKSLCDSEDVISAFENWQPQHAYHIQSFALSVSKSVFYSDAFQKFWENYIPVANRYFAIQHGEKKLSKAILKVSQSSRIIFSISRTRQFIQDARNSDIDPIDTVIACPIELRGRMAQFLEEDASHSARDIAVLENISMGSPIHTGLYYFSRLGCPIVKKDVVFRNQYNFWDVESILTKVYEQNELDEYLTMLRKKGAIRDLKPFDRLITLVGGK